MLQLWRAFPHYRRQAQVSTWMYRIALNTAISLFRRQARQPARAAFGTELLNMPQFTGSPEADERMQQFYTAVEQLTPVETAVSIGLARVAGLFTDHHLAELRAQVNELEELR